MAEYRMLTVTQLAAILQKSKQTVRRRVNDLEKEGLVEVTGREFGRGRGRPENSLGLTESGVDILKNRGQLNKDVSYGNVCADCLFCADHQLLLNWFRIHLNQVEKALPRVSIKLFAHNSPFLPKNQNGSILIADGEKRPKEGQNKVDRFQQGSLSSLIIAHDDVEMFVHVQFKRAKGLKSFDFDFLYVHKCALSVTVLVNKLKSGTPH